MASLAHSNIAHSGNDSVTDAAISQLVRLQLADSVTAKSSLQLSISMLPRRKTFTKRTTTPIFQIRRRPLGPGAPVRRLFAPAPAPNLPAAANAARDAEDNFFAELEQEHLAAFVNRWFTDEYNWEPVQQHNEQGPTLDEAKHEDNDSAEAQAQPCDCQQ
eukprot:GEZU01008275.1.p1 GENE.GEZU01008275.1~~GEZU01008275.1.p1  ORF type:complete len:160 (+),score=33.64 GEZU01008275.1:178-657(+)